MRNELEEKVFIAMLASGRYSWRENEGRIRGLIADAFIYAREFREHADRVNPRPQIPPITDARPY